MRGGFLRAGADWRPLFHLRCGPLLQSGAAGLGFPDVLGVVRFRKDLSPRNAGKGPGIRGSKLQPQGALELAVHHGVLQADQAKRSETVELKVRAPVGLTRSRVAECRRT